MHNQTVQCASLWSFLDHTQIPKNLNISRQIWTFSDVDMKNEALKKFSFSALTMIFFHA